VLPVGWRPDKNPRGTPGNWRQGLGREPKERGADANFRGAFLNGDLKVVGHTHGEDGKRKAGNTCEIVADGSQSLEIGTDFLGIVEVRRDTHQAGEI